MGLQTEWAAKDLADLRAAHQTELRDMAREALWLVGQHARWASGGLVMLVDLDRAKAVEARLLGLAGGEG